MPLKFQNEQSSKGQFFGKFIIFGVFEEKSLDIMKDDYFEKNFWKKSHSTRYLMLQWK